MGFSTQEKKTRERHLKVMGILNNQDYIEITKTCIILTKREQRHVLHKISCMQCMYKYRNIDKWETITYY